MSSIKCKERIIMKKSKIIITAALCLINTNPTVSYAEGSSNEVLNYIKLSQMTDEEFVQIYDYSEYSFGNNAVPDDEKFRKYLDKVPASYIGENFTDNKYHMLKRFTDGKLTPYITIYIDRYTPLDVTLTADAFGYPKEWKISALDGAFEIESSVLRQLHEYRIEVPNDVITDFESYIRLEKSYSLIRNSELFEDPTYGIKNHGDIFTQFHLYGDNTSNIYGDANCDFRVMMNDAVLVMQSLSNPDRFSENGSDIFHITSQGKINADMDGNGLSANDALLIQKMLLKLNS